MTTVAWDGKTLAGDTLALRGGLRNYCESKVFRVPFGDSGHQVLIGCSGDEAVCMQVVQWIRGGMQEEKRPKLPEDSFNGILVKLDGWYRLDSHLIELRGCESFHAIGHGRDFAIAAMEIGKTAREAIELAIKFDAYTGGDVTEVSLA